MPCNQTSYIMLAMYVVHLHFIGMSLFQVTTLYITMKSLFNEPLVEWHFVHKVRPFIK